MRRGPCQSNTEARSVQLGRKPSLPPAQINHARRLIDSGEDHPPGAPYTLSVNCSTLCRNFDRLARSLKEGINVLADWCQRSVRVIAITQQIDLSGPAGHLIASFLFGIPEIELAHVKERQTIGIVLAKKTGVYTGRKPGATKAKPSRARALRR
jgi:hypothetical protein